MPVPSSKGFLKIECKKLLFVNARMAWNNSYTSCPEHANINMWYFFTWQAVIKSCVLNTGEALLH